MGLLDDAIREHLELKRRHGADPGDLAKLEREAFGPIKRGAEPAEEPEPEAAAPAAPKPEPVDPVLTEPEVDAPPPAPAAAEEVVEEEHVTWDPPAHEPVHGPGQPTEAFDAADLAEAEGRPDPEPAPPAPRRDDAGDAEDADDVLEETPEFLQETPEHDRLWFEQRPPRDFDFDG